MDACSLRPWKNGDECIFSWKLRGRKINLIKHIFEILNYGFVLSFLCTIGRATMLFLLFASFADTSFLKADMDVSVRWPLRQWCDASLSHPQPIRGLRSVVSSFSSAGSGAEPSSKQFLDSLYAISWNFMRVFREFWKLAVRDNNTKNAKKNIN